MGKVKKLSFSATFGDEWASTVRNVLTAVELMGDEAADMFGQVSGRTGDGVDKLFVKEAKWETLSSSEKMQAYLSACVHLMSAIQVAVMQGNAQFFANGKCPFPFVTRFADFSEVKAKSMRELQEKLFPPTENN